MIGRSRMALTNRKRPPSFFGGGTPTILKASDLVAMLNAVRDTWGIADNAEITTEANPDTVNADYVKELADGGFNRISFGMQSAVPSVLKTLDRTHTPAMWRRESQRQMLPACVPAWI